MSADASTTNWLSHSPDTADFCLSPEEVRKGEQAVSSYISSVKPPDGRRIAEEALDTLATVISGGLCDAQSFPWHQVRAYHGALALSIIKEPGAPAHVEALRCRQDENRKYQVVPEAYLGKQVLKMKHTLRGVIETCGELGFISEDEMLAAVPPSRSATSGSKAKSGKPQPAKSKTRERTLEDGEVRALLAACSMGSSTSGSRDLLMIGLAYMGALRTVDLVNLTLDDLHYDSKRGKVTLKVRQTGSKRAKHLPLENEQLIALEDWLEVRGRETGPLFCPVTRSHRVEVKRMSAAEVSELCEHRAERSGVRPFVPNDLARSSTQSNGASKRRRGRNGVAVAAESPPSDFSPLFEGGEEPATDQPELIHFPYRVKVGS